MRECRPTRSASALYQLALADEVEVSRLKVNEISWWAWDALNLADAGHIEETREHVVNQILTALEEAASSEGLSWTVSVSL